MKLNARNKSNDEHIQKATSQALTFYDDNYTYIDTSLQIIYAKDNT